MKVLLTGASGFVGSNVLEYMLDKTDWDFTCLCSWRHYGNQLNIKPNKRVKVISCDLTGTIPDVGQFDYILNLASESHVDRSIATPVPFIENNISLMLQMLEYARKHPPKVFLQFSTDEVYGAMEHKEWDVLLPSNPYASSKASQEMICIAYWKTYAVPIVITNSNNIVGKNQNPEKFVPKIKQIITDGGTVEIHANNGKAGKRYWNAVQNVADALLFILGQEPAVYGQGINKLSRYSLGGGTELDNLQMAELVALILGKPLIYKMVNAETVRQGYDEFYGETNSGLETLGWQPIISLEDCLKGFL